MIRISFPRRLLVLVWACLVLSGCGPSPPRTGPPAIKGVWHTLQRGDTLFGMARRYRIPVQDIEEINGLQRSDTLVAGRKIFIPGAAKVLRLGEGTAGADPSRTKTKPPGKKGQAGKETMAWPVIGGKLSSRFGPRGKRAHEGIDIAAPEGTAVVAARSGTVIYAGSGVKGYGEMIIIRHAEGLVTVYAHNRRNLVQEGVEVRRGQVIAEVGHTGRTTGNHLHFEVRKGETPKNPLKYV